MHVVACLIACVSRLLALHIAILAMQRRTAGTGCSVTNGGVQRLCLGSNVNVNVNPGQPQHIKGPQAHVHAPVPALRPAHIRTRALRQVQQAMESSTSKVTSSTRAPRSNSPAAPAPPSTSPAPGPAPPMHMPGPGRGSQPDLQDVDSSDRLHEIKTVFQDLRTKRRQRQRRFWEMIRGASQLGMPHHHHDDTSSSSPLELMGVSGTSTCLLVTAFMFSDVDGFAPPEAQVRGPYM